MTKKQTLWEATSLHCKIGKRRYLHVSNKRKTLSNCGKILPKDGCTSFQGFYWLTRCVKHWDALYIIIWLLNWILYVSKKIEGKCGMHRQFDQDGLAAQYLLLSYPNANHDCGCCMIPIPHFESKSDEMSVWKAPETSVIFVHAQILVLSFALRKHSYIMF